MTKKCLLLSPPIAKQSSRDISTRPELLTFIFRACTRAYKLILRRDTYFFPSRSRFTNQTDYLLFWNFRLPKQFKTRFNIFSRQRRSPCFILFAFRCNVCKFAPRLNFRSIDLPINSKFSTITNFLAFFLFLLFNILPISCILHFTGITLSYQAVLLHRLEFRLGG